MGLIAKNEPGVEIPKLEDGVYTAISKMLIDLGVQVNQFNQKKSRKIMIVWQILNETVEIKGEELPRVISKEYTLSLHEKATLRKDLEAWRGKAFSEQELQGFDLLNILNIACQLQVINVKKNDKTYTNLAAIMAMPKGTQIENLEETIYFNTCEKETWGNYDKVPRWIQEKIKKSETLKETGLDEYIRDYDQTKANVENSARNENIEDLEEIAPDELPF